MKETLKNRKEDFRSEVLKNRKKTLKAGFKELKRSKALKNKDREKKQSK
jgi:hypothetical protein